MENLSQVECKYAEEVKRFIKNGRINMFDRQKIDKRGKELAISRERCLEIEKQLLTATTAQPTVDAPRTHDVERKERERLADLERKQEEARKEAARLEAARRRAEDQAKHEREMAEQARMRREEEERKAQERREAEHKRQLAEQDRIHKEAEKAAEMRAEAERVKREAAEAKAAAELAKKDAELKAQQAKMEAKAATELARKNAELEVQRAEAARLRAQQSTEAAKKSPQKRWAFILLGLLLGYLGIHLAYARRWVLLVIFWGALIGFVSNCGESKKTAGEEKAPTEETPSSERTGGNDAVAVPCFLTVAGLWLGGTFFIKKDGKKRRLS